MNPRKIGCLLIAFLIPNSAHAGDLIFTKHTINAEVDYSAAALIDVNHDGQLDVVCGGDWYEGPSWKRHKAATVPRIRGRPDGFSHLPFDVNRDGWVDVITVNYRSSSIRWMENPGYSQTPWRLHTVVEPGPMETGRLVDVDGDGQLDLLPNGKDFAAWWEFRWQDKTQKGLPAWIRHELPREVQGHGIGFGDIDGDGHDDIVGQNGWLKSPPDARTGNWSWNPEFQLERASIPMLVVDPDQDGDNDIVWCSAHGFGAYWLENATDSAGNRLWIRHSIDTSWSQCHAPLWADLDGDTVPELIAGKRYMAHGGSDPGAYDPLVAYRYQFNPATNSWDRWEISSGDRVGFGLDPKVGDIDQDGDLDLLACGRSGLYWLENLGPPPVRKSKAPDVNGSAGRVSLSKLEDLGRRRARTVESIKERFGVRKSWRPRCPLNLLIGKQYQENLVRIQEISFSVEDNLRCSATLYLPNKIQVGESAGIVSAFDHSSADSASEAARKVAENGHVCIVLGELVTQPANALDLAIWKVVRAADVLQATSEVHGERIGFLGNAHMGQLGLLAAAIDQRFIASVAGCSESPNSSMPNADEVSDLLACISPRAIKLILPEDATVSRKLKENAALATDSYQLRGANKKLSVEEHRPLEAPEVISWLIGNL